MFLAYLIFDVTKGERIFFIYIMIWIFLCYIYTRLLHFTNFGGRKYIYICGLFKLNVLNSIWHLQVHLSFLSWFACSTCFLIVQTIQRLTFSTPPFLLEWLYKEKAGNLDFFPSNWWSPGDTFFPRRVW